MKQVLQDARTGAITVSEVPAPQLLPGCVLVEIAVSLVSAGTERASAEFASKNLLQKAKARPDLVREVLSKVQRDGLVSAMRAVRSRLDQPSIPGYSSAGTIIAVAPEITDLRVGDRVACAGAGYATHAEFANVPRLLIARIPDDTISFEQAAFSTVGAVCMHGVRTAEVKLGDTVAVIGLGLLGQLTVQLLRAAGCNVLGLDILPERARLATQLGAQASGSSSTEFKELCMRCTHGHGVDAVLITAETPSSDPVNLAGEIARQRAIVLAVGTVGMDIRRKNFYEKELDFRISRSYGPGRYDTAYEQKGRDYPIGYVRWTETRNMDAFLQLLADKKVDLMPLITHRFPVEQASEAYRVISGETRDPFLGVLIHYAEAGKAKVGAPERTFSLSSSTSKPDVVALGVIGAGTFAQGVLLPQLKKLRGASLVGVCTATGAHSKHVAEKFGFRFCTTDEREILQSSEINSVLIATRHHLHATAVIAALEAGKNVFCEKPLCLNEDELRSVIKAYTSDQSRVLMVGFNRRFSPMAVKVKKFFADIREPLALHYRVNAGFLPPDHWTNDPEQGGGRILGEVCHFVDLLSFLTGAPIVEVQARPLGGTARYSGDNVIVSLRFENGSEGTISYLANGDRSFSKERVEVFGGGAVAVLEDFRRLELVRDGRSTTETSRLSQDKGHESELITFIDSVRGTSKIPLSFEDTVEATLATLRIQQSIAVGKPLPVNTREFLQETRNSRNSLS
ncbi:MAG TPA: bi-domain-containing oxidoreductase [Terriglobales bacterium]|jgi:predicted dehydrogenase/threonine dehydrogenase-like Zn-dependent dehydrogenase|nr:bi-domain-containing oxidoreductase [Terriglobales bacterium]